MVVVVGRPLPLLEDVVVVVDPDAVVVGAEVEGGPLPTPGLLPLWPGPADVVDDPELVLEAVVPGAVVAGDPVPAVGPAVPAPLVAERPTGVVVEGTATGGGLVTAAGPRDGAAVGGRTGGDTTGRCRAGPRGAPARAATVSPSRTTTATTTTEPAARASRWRAPLGSTNTP